MRTQAEGEIICDEFYPVEKKIEIENPLKIIKEQINFGEIAKVTDS